MNFYSGIEIHYRPFYSGIEINIPTMEDETKKDENGKEADEKKDDEKDDNGKEADEKKNDEKKDDEKKEDEKKEEEKKEDEAKMSRKYTIQCSNYMIPNLMSYSEDTLVETPEEERDLRIGNFYIEFLD